jgi:fructokinase
MITVAGEALFDIIVDEAGTPLMAMPGGGPFNVARFVSLLGEQCCFLGRLSDDRFGMRLRAELDAAAVQLAVPATVTAPTTLAIAQLDTTGSARYRFYAQGTSAVALSHEDVPPAVINDSRALALGGLSLVFEPVRSSLLELAERAGDSLLIFLDPNCRPSAIPDLESYRHTIELLLRSADIVKASVEDLELICPTREPISYATELVVQGHLGMVVVTDGPNAVTLISRKGLRALAVPNVAVVDTIGAGDAIVAGLLAWVASHSDIDPRSASLDVLQAAVEAAIEVAAAVCTVRGAALPVGFVWASNESYRPRG